MNIEETITKLYDHFLKKIYNKKDFKSNLKDEKLKKIVKKFINTIHKQNGLGTVGINFLVDYFCFQFHYWNSKNTVNQFSLSWVIGDKAIDRWNCKVENYQYFYQVELLNQYNIIYTDLIKIGNENIHTNDLVFDSEEREKRFFEGSMRLVHCIDNTTLFNPHSKICTSCTEQQSCKEILLNSQELQLIAIKRGLYDQNN